ncbi:hypothetical protein [Isoptericola variabilis]|uniref:Uncharacterized protein n=1 Tax=Isoptericola variabilis (strain 225) TaxID=743718 RepID=F6FS89_ISOV2|nr:hypothetical protein [Isoptericola variabilis]AEG43030.1 hypothetical protein Isova_0225 [Isoptericola variabilis 225]TWH27065.1 hypothetical protein L600_005700000020 [Isoptericola variabilis J7]
MTDTPYRSIANPRRTRLASAGSADAASPRGDEHSLQMLGDDGAACADGACSVTD